MRYAIAVSVIKTAAGGGDDFGSRGHVAFDLNCLKFSAVVYSMFQMLMVAAGHLLILALAIFGLRLSHRYISGRFIRSSVHCPTQLAPRANTRPRLAVGTPCI